MNAIINILLLIKSFLLEIGELAFFAGRFSENLSGGPLNLKNSFVNAFMESLFIVGRRYWIHHWFGFYLAITSYSSRVWRRVVDAIHGEYFDNEK
jgi:hypothetical protein